jgi:hypothetical protein
MSNQINVTEIDKESVALGLDSGLSMTEITLSSATFAQSTEQDGSFPSDDFDIIVSNVDVTGLVNEGDDTQFDRTYQWKPSYTTIVKKLNLILCAGLNVSAWTSGNFSLDSVQVIITRNLPDGTQLEEILNETHTSGLGNLASTGTQLFITKFNTNRDIKIDPAKVIQIRIIVNHTEDTGTIQQGIVPFFCFNDTATNKFFTNCEAKLHLEKID